jgi:signal transduction histidine kinase
MDRNLDDLKKINSSGQYLLALINNILDMAKIEAGGMQLHCERFAVGPVLDHVGGIAESLAARKGNRFALESAGDPGEIFADRTKLKQSLLNLIRNACKFTSGGNVVLLCRRYHSSGRERVEFRVCDTGVGIAADRVAALFKPFTQADSSISAKFGGTGLGLSISRSFCRMMGGDIFVESELGRGSAFIIDLPVDSASAQENPSSLIAVTT